MQHLDSWGEDDHEKVPKQPKTARKELINDLETVGTSVTKETIGDTLCCNGLKSCSIQKVSILHKAHVQARLRVASKHDSEKALVKVLWLVENDIELFGISSACWEGLSMTNYPLLMNLKWVVMSHLSYRAKVREGWTFPKLLAHQYAWPETSKCYWKYSSIHFFSIYPI